MFWNVLLLFSGIMLTIRSFFTISVFSLTSCTRLMVDINEVKWEQEVPKYPDCKQVGEKSRTYFLI